MREREKGGGEGEGGRKREILADLPSVGCVFEIWA